MVTKKARPPVEPPPIRMATPEEKARGLAGVEQAKANALKYYTPEQSEAARQKLFPVAMKRLDNLWADDKMREKQRKGEILGPRGW